MRSQIDVKKMYNTLLKLIRNELILKIYETLWTMLLGFETPLHGGEGLPISSYGLSIALGFEIPNFLTNLPNFIKKCTKSCKWCSKICQGCTKGLKVYSRIANDLSLIKIDP